MEQQKNRSAEEILAMIRERQSSGLPIKWWIQDNKWKVAFTSLILGFSFIIFGVSKTLTCLFFAVLFCLVCAVSLMFFMLPFIFLQLIIDEIGRSVARHIKE